jgi:hypothetical protein
MFSFLTNGLNALYAILIAAVISLLGGIYLGHNYEKNYYEAKINSEKVSREEAINKAIIDEQAKNAKATEAFISTIRREQAKSAAYQEQAKSLYAINGSVSPSDNCRVTYGFIRLFNASASGETSSPDSTDSISSPVDLAAVLSTSIENHRKYREVAGQIEAIKAANE